MPKKKVTIVVWWDSTDIITLLTIVLENNLKVIKLQLFFIFSKYDLQFNKNLLNV